MQTYSAELMLASLKDPRSLTPSPSQSSALSGGHVTGLPTKQQVTALAIRGGLYQSLSHFTAESLLERHNLGN